MSATHRRFEHSGHHGTTETSLIPRVLHAADDSLDAAAGVFHARQNAGHRSTHGHPGKPARPNSEWPGQTVQTPEVTPPPRKRSGVHEIGSTPTEFRQFLAQIDRATPPELALHLIVDNSSTHTTEAIRDFLAAHPRFHLHFTPTSASWLNAVETWFGQLERRALRRGVFTSVSELRDEIRRFIETHNMHSANPFRWTKSARATLDAVERARQSLRQETSRTGR